MAKSLAERLEAQANRGAVLQVRLRRLRITQEDVALAMGVDRSTLTRWLNGRRLCPTDFEARFDEALAHVKNGAAA